MSLTLVTLQRIDQETPRDPTSSTSRPVALALDNVSVPVPDLLLPWEDAPLATSITAALQTAMASIPVANNALPIASSSQHRHKNYKFVLNNFRAPDTSEDLRSKRRRNSKAITTVPKVPKVPAKRRRKLAGKSEPGANKATEAGEE